MNARISLVTDENLPQSVIVMVTALLSGYVSENYVIET
jgi:hypothetical protein